MKKLLSFFLLLPSLLHSQCEFSNLVTEFSDCSESNTFTIDFEFENDATGTFTVYFGQDYVETFEYGETFYTIGPFEGVCPSYYEAISLVDDADPSCNIEAEILQPCCDCYWTQVFADPTFCNDDGTFDVYLTWEILNPDAATFTVQGNGITYGTEYSYDDPFVLIEGLQGDCETIYEFVLTDNENPDCSTFTFLEEAICCEVAMCEIQNLAYQDVTCLSDNEYLVNIDFDVIDPGNEYFEIWVNGVYLDYYLLNQLPLEIGPLSAFLENEVEVCINDVPDCCATMIIPPQECEATECIISELFAEISECDADGNYQVVFDFEIENPEAGSFNVYLNDAFIENIPYEEEGPYSIGPFEGNCAGELELYVQDELNEDCSDSYIYEVPCCESNDCTLLDLVAEAYGCNEEDMFMIDFSFFVEGSTADSFYFIFNEDTIGTFAYGMDFYTVGPFEENCEEGPWLKIMDTENPACVDELDLEPVCCSQDVICEVFDLEVFDIVCLDENYLSFYINFGYENPESEWFDLFVNDEFYGLYSLEDLPTQVEEALLEDIIVVEVCINDNPDCCTAFEFEGPNCSEEEEQCQMTGLFIETYDCDEDGGFLIDFEFDVTDPDAGSFNVFVNDAFIANFQYGETFYTVGPFDGDCETIYDLYLVDEVNEDCFIANEFGPVCCNEEESCEVFDLEAFDFICLNEDYFSLYINFNYVNPDNEFFDLYVNGDFYGFYSLEDLPLFVEEVPIEEIVVIDVCINDNEDCCSTIEFEGPDCSEDSECQMNGLFIETYECNEEGGFLIDFAFEVIEPDAGSFNVFVNEEFISNFQYGEPFYTVGPFEGDCETVYDLFLVDEVNDDCFIANEFGPVCCDEEEEFCEVFDLEAFDFICVSDDYFTFYINFSYEDPGNEFFDLFINGDFYDFYPLEELPILVEEIPAEGLVIVDVCINDNPDCCTTIEFEAPNCEDEDDECVMEGLFIETYECDEEGNFLIDFEFDVTDPDAGSFNVYVNDAFIANFQYGEPYYTVGPFDGDCETIYDLYLVDEINENCFIADEFGPVCCDDEEPECEVFGLEVFDIDCNDESYFSFYINFAYENPDNEFFDLFVNGSFFGFYGLEELPVLVEEVLAEGVVVVEVCINDNPDCCTVTEFEAPNCEEEDGECIMDELFIEAHECDEVGGFLVDFEFDVSDPDAGSFNVFVNDEFIDNFQYGELFYTVGPFDGDCETIYDLFIVDELNENCFVADEFGPVCCEEEEEECELWDLEVFDILCLNEDLFSFYLSFNYENATDEFFDVFINEDFYDFFELDQLPILVEDIIAQGTIVVEVCINDNPDCCTSIEFETPDCQEEDSECLFDGLIIETSECDEEGDFYIDFEFDAIDPDAGSFNVFVNDEFIENFQYGEDYYTVGPFEGDCETVYDLYIVDEINEDCFIAGDFGPICCESGFRIQYGHNEIIYSAAPNGFELMIYQNTGREVGKYSLQGSGRMSIADFDASIYIMVYEMDGVLYSKKIFKY